MHRPYAARAPLIGRRIDHRGNSHSASADPVQPAIRDAGVEVTVADAG
jgi:hypothetical protein